MGEVTVLTSPSLPQHYLDFIQNKVNFFFFYPEEAAKQGWQGQVEISLLLDSEGNVKDTKITQSSGYKLLDEAAAWTILNASPFTPDTPFSEEKEVHVQLVYSQIAPPPSLEPEGTVEAPPLTQALTEEETYEYTIARTINSLLVYPSEAKAKGLGGEAKVKFTITQKGTVQRAQITESTGYTPLDNAILLAVQGGQPYPFPPDVKEDSIEVTIPITFEGEQPSPSTTAEAPIPLPVVFGEPMDEGISAFLEENEEIRNLFQIAQENSQLLKIARDQVNLATLKVREVVRNLYPSVGIEYTTTEGETITDPYQSKTFGVKAQQIVYDSGQRSNSIERERLNVKVAKESFRKVRNDLFFEVVKAYFQLQQEMQSFSLLTKYKKIFEDYFETASLLKDAMLITEIEFLQDQNIYIKSESEFVAQENRFDLAVANLKKIIGVKPDKELPQLSDNEFKEEIVLSQPLSEYIQLGMEKRPEISLLENTIQATGLGYRVARVENRPKFFLETFWGRSGEAYGNQSLDLSETWNVVGKVVWLFGGNSFETSYTTEKTVPTDIAQISNKTDANTISFRMGLLDKMRYYTETQEGQVALKQAEDELLKVQKDIAWEAQEGFSTFMEATKRLISIKKEVETTKKEVDLKKELFKAGEVQLSELMQAEVRTMAAENSALKTKLEVYLGLLVLDKATAFNVNLVSKL